MTLASGVFLACVRDIHGAALLAGVALVAVLGGVARGPLRSRPAESTRSGTASSPRLDVAADATGPTREGSLLPSLADDRCQVFG